jgi:hypothetical protein
MAPALPALLLSRAQQPCAPRDLGLPVHSARGTPRTHPAVQPTRALLARTGTWYHAGYHIATTIATPAAFAPLPWAFSRLGWTGGVISLFAATLVTYYNSMLLASLHHLGGKRNIRYSELGRKVYGELLRNTNSVQALICPPECTGIWTTSAPTRLNMQLIFFPGK